MSTAAVLSVQPPALASGALPLSDWGLIRAQGEDAGSFLQGQLTQDVASLEPGQARLAGYCSAKGRLLASFVVWRVAPDEWLLACSADLLAATLKRLSMFVLRARCKLSDASAELALWGLCGSDAQAWLGAAAAAGPMSVSASPQATLVIRLADAAGVARWLCVAPVGVALNHLPPLAPDIWRWLEVESGVVRIVAATADAFVPQMVNFELVGGVNFKKGCYPGQEVVARSQYRGTLKRRATLLAGAAAMQAGQEVFHSADPGQPAGTIALAAGVDGQHLALVELKRVAMQGGSLHLAAAEGPALQCRPLPYELPSDEP